MARNRNGTLSNMDRFADLLAESDGNVPAVGARLGLSMKQANDVMQRLRKALGWQAR